MKFKGISYSGLGIFGMKPRQVCNRLDFSTTMMLSLVLVLALLFASTASSAPFYYEKVAVLRGGGPFQKKVNDVKAKAKSTQAKAVKQVKAATKTEPTSKGLVDKALLLKVNAFIGMTVGASWVLETFGMDVPFTGMAATMQGADPTDPVVAFLTRFVGSMLLFSGLVQLEFGDNKKIQDFFLLYHIPLTLSAVAAAKATAQGPCGWMAATIISTVTLLSLV